MAFEFSLETLLRLYTSYERKERMRLEELARKISATRARLAEIEAERRAAARVQTESLTGGLTASEMHFTLACDGTREEQHRQLSNQLVQLSKEHRAQHNVYLEARQKRETLDSLREHKLREYRVEQDRRQQQAQDDLFLMRARRDLPGDPATVAALPGAVPDNL